MRKLILGILVATSLCSVAWAHHDDCTPGILLPNGGVGLLITGGTMVEFSPAPEDPLIIVGVTYRGYNQETGSHHVYHRWFQVGVQAAFDTGGTDAATVFNNVRVNIVPWARVETSHRGVVQSLRVLPLDLRPVSREGINSSYTVSAIGFTYQAQGPLVGEYDEHRLARFAKYIQLAVDLIGLRYANFGENNHYVGGQVGQLNVIGGLAWNISEAVALRVGLGARGDLSLGGNATTGAFTALGETEFFARLELLIRTIYVRMSIFADVGIHSFHNLAIGGAPASMTAPATGHTHDHGTTEPAHSDLNSSHPYLFVGMNVSF